MNSLEKFKVVCLSCGYSLTAKDLERKINGHPKDCCGHFTEFYCPNCKNVETVNEY